LWLAPRLWLLGRGRNSRIFQDRSVPEIVSAVLGEAKVDHVFRLLNVHAPRSYCVQHEETDLRFVKRLLAEEGIFFSFEHGPGEADREVVVLSDSADLGVPLPGDPALALAHVDGMAAAGAVRAFRLGRRVRSGSTLLSQFDFHRPSFDLHAPSEVTNPADVYDERPLWTYHHLGELEGDAVDPSAASLQLEQRRRRAVLAEGEGRARRLEAGRWFELTGNAVPSLDGRYTVVRVEHTATSPDGARFGAQGQDVYENRFHCIPADVAPRPKRPKRRIQQVMETATVVGPGENEIHTDNLGRIKVQFHWDLQGQHDERSSCWIRTMQPWAGTGWGFQFIPRVGMEVLVLFLSGDTDRPMVVGAAYNAEHPVPFPLPGSKTKSGIRTQSTPATTGYNELSFEDRAGWERVHIHAERDHETVVKNDKTSRVGNNSTEQVTGNRFTLVTGNDLKSIGGNRTESVAGDEARTIAGSRTWTVDGNASDVLRGNLDAHFAKDASVRVDGRERREIAGDSDLVVKSDLVQRVTGNHLTTVGRHDAKRSYVLHVEGVTEVSGTDKTVFSSDAGITLRCGDTSITLTPERLEISSPAIVLTGADASIALAEEEVIMKAASRILGVSDDLVHLVSSGASVKLTGDALIGGSKVKLKDQDSESLEDEEAETIEPTTIELVDENGDPIPDQRYVITVGGVERSGVLDADGKAEIPGLEEDATIRFPGLADAQSA
jgi:type VI secretion system secreted protein VgrG